MAADTRTGPLVKRLVEGVQEDLTEIAQQVAEVRDRLVRLEGETKGINGLAASCRAWGQLLAKMHGDVEAEVEAVEKKMLGAAQEKEKIHEVVNIEHAESVRAARRGA